MDDYKIEGLKQEIKSLRIDLSKEIAEVRSRQHHYAELHNELEKKMIGISADIEYLKKGQDSMNKNLSTFLWLIGGGFITTIIAWIVKGSLLGG